MHLVSDRTTSESTDFQSLVQDLDAYLTVVNGESHSFFNQYNQINHLKNCVVVYVNNEPIGCGALKIFDTEIMEIKRMYVKENYRGKGVAKFILTALEQWAKEIGNKACVLETSKTMLDAVSLYKSFGYLRIPNYGQYIGVEVSICFKKII